MNSNLDELNRALAMHSSAYQAVEDAKYNLDRAQEVVGEAKAKVARDEAPKLTGKTYKWVDPNDTSGRFRSATLFLGVEKEKLIALRVEQGLLSDAAINLRREEPGDSMEHIEAGWLVEITRAEFDAEYARVLALLSPRPTGETRT